MHSVYTFLKVCRLNLPPALSRTHKTYFHRAHQPPEHAEIILSSTGGRDPPQKSNNKQHARGRLVSMQNRASYDVRQLLINGLSSQRSGLRVPAWIIKANFLIALTKIIFIHGNSGR